MPPASERYPHRNLHGRIVHALGRRILRGEILPGDALEAGSTMAASRTALREAIKVLTAKGLVEARPKIGTRVTPRESWHLLDPDVLAWQHDPQSSAAFLKKLTEVRAVIEPQSAALAAERADDDAVRALEAAFADMVAPLEERPEEGTEGWLDAFVDADMRFHLTILRATGNDLLEHMSRVVYSALIVSFRMTSEVPGSARRALPAHRAVLRAIAAHDGPRAHAAMRRLVASTASEIARLAAPDAAPEREPRERTHQRLQSRRPGTRKPTSRRR
jgi:DNA-binding FadR family transcriptional regulator